MMEEGLILEADILEAELTEKITKRVTQQVTEQVTQQVTREIKEDMICKLYAKLKDAKQVAELLELPLDMVQKAVE